jgi:hypothetical protein
MQSVVSTHVTSFRPPPPPPKGVGVTFHAAPFQISEIGLKNSSLPTARQKALERHDTPDSPAPMSPGFASAFWVDQFSPFQYSTRRIEGLLLTNESPTAVHVEGEVHDTEASELPSGDGLGDATIVHVVPSQLLARVAFTPALSKYSPTAAQDVGDEQDTPFS